MLLFVVSAPTCALGTLSMDDLHSAHVTVMDFPRRWSYLRVDKYRDEERTDVCDVHVAGGKWYVHVCSGECAGRGNGCLENLCFSVVVFIG